MGARSYSDKSIYTLALRRQVKMASFTKGYPPWLMITTSSGKSLATMSTWRGSLWSMIAPGTWGGGAVVMNTGMPSSQHLL